MTGCESVRSFTASPQTKVVVILVSTQSIEQIPNNVFPRVAQLVSSWVRQHKKSWTDVDGEDGAESHSNLIPRFLCLRHPANREAAVRVLTYSRGEAARDGRVHPTQKPLALMKWCIGLVDDVASVIDPFMGSGTTLVAAKLLGLRAVGIEINREYCEAAVERLRQGVLCFDSEG